MGFFKDLNYVDYDVPTPKQLIAKRFHIKKSVLFFLSKQLNAI